MGEVDGELYIATRLVSSTLRNLIVAGPIAVDVAMKVLSRVASALDAAHAHGVVHRDVKPANVLMDPGPEVYLGDFGLARDPEGEALTAPGQVLGTIDYMAPELLDGERVGAATDIYGLACLAVETLTGTVPFCATLTPPPCTPTSSTRHRASAPAGPSCRARSTTCWPPAWPRIPTTARPRPGALVVEMLEALGRPAPACLAQAA